LSRQTLPVCDYAGFHHLVSAIVVSAEAIHDPVFEDFYAKCEERIDSKVDIAHPPAFRLDLLWSSATTFGFISTTR